MILTATELAARLRISERQVYRLIDQGCPSMLVGTRRRFDWQDVKAWTESQCPSEKTPKAATTSRSASTASAFTDAARKVHLRVMPSN